MANISPDVLTAPITALSFYKSFLLAGEGPNLHVYSTESKIRLSTALVLPAANIHGLITCKDDTRICVFGSKKCRVLELSRDEIPRILPVSDVAEFEDWIWDVCWLREETKDEWSSLGVALGHNTVIHWDWQTGQRLHTVHCHEKCIIYAALFLGETWESVVLAAGTVFNQVVVWGMSDDEGSAVRKKVLQRLLGHQGVIFSITYNTAQRCLCSVSDDRSIRLWNIVTSSSSQSLSLSEWAGAEVQPFLVLYGHAARVWDAKLLSNFIVSIGEDATCCVWNYEGEIIHKFKGHKGKSIWSLAANEENALLATGGGDSSIRLWSIDCGADMAASVITTCLPAPPPAQSHFFPRCLKILNDDTLVVITNDGKLYSHTLSTGEWKVMLDDPDFSSYSVMEVSPDGSIIVVGNISGKILVIFTDHSFVDKIYTGKVFSILWVKAAESHSYNLLTTGPDGSLDIWEVGQGSTRLRHLQSFTLPPGKQRWVSAAACLPDHRLLVCGDRGGTVHVYNLQEKEPVESFWKVHGKAGVTDVCYHGNSVYTAGRDGHIREYSINSERGQLQLLHSNKVLKGLEWISKLMFVDGDMLVLGFHTNHFIVFSMNTNQKLVSVPCGGGHRAWNFSLHAESAIFVYIKTRDVILSQSNIQTKHTVLKPSLHGRELTDIKYIFEYEDSEGMQCVYATASEDTSVNVVSIQRQGDTSREESAICDLNILFSIQGHISSVRALAVSRSCLSLSASQDINKSTEVKLVFSAGGRAQMKCWRLHCTKRSGEQDINGAASAGGHKVIHDAVWYEAIGSYMLQWKGRKQSKPWKTEFYDSSPETRFMALSVFSLSEVTMDTAHAHLHIVAAACSDGFVRLFCFDELGQKFHVLTESSFHDHCVLCIKHVITDPANQRQVYVISAGTDGRVAFWNISTILKELITKVQEETKEDLSMTNATEKVEDEDGECDEDGVENGPLHRVQDSEETLVASDSSCNSAKGKLQRNKKQIKHSELPWRCEDLGEPMYSVMLHQSGVNSLAIKHIEGFEYMVACGGDDNALNVLRMSMGRGSGQEESVELLQQAKVESAHAAQITGVDILDRKHLVSVSIDQLVIIWAVTTHPQPRISPLCSKFIDVADVAAMEIHKSKSGTIQASVCGMGLQSLTISGLDGTS